MAEFPSVTLPDDVLLRVEDLRVEFPVKEGLLRQRQVASIKAVDGVSLDLRRGETLSLVGESGCGKSTMALTIMRLQQATAGRIIFEGTDITSLRGSSLRPFRRRMQMVFQDPFGSLDPRMTVRDIVGEPLVVHGLSRDRKAYSERIAALMELVGLLPNMANRYPHEFSGGQRQRIGIARALALEPDVIICDEPVSALDVSIQSQILNLLMDLQERLKLSYLFISHDLSVVRHISNRVAVMYLGRIVELASADEIFRIPRHPYTRTLIAAAPSPNLSTEAERMASPIIGEIPSPRNVPSGCRFHPRCPSAVPQCSIESPSLSTSTSGGKVWCQLYEPDTGIA
jgi:oligopeptide transport system ATP-binding protein